ncbi:MAG: cytosolic protein [Nanoarchaeota archaeon]|nr:cytosolic protein [Nanoarchaeota archaeon]MBU4116578.1 cytosolic protein [Nanoarchaeota archaeon]
MECEKEKNKKFCNCTYSCGKKGKCCECLRHHLQNRELPACCFPKDVEKTYNRGFEKFAELVEENKI